MGDEINHLYLVKKGDVVCFDDKYEYMCHLEPGSFFGEFNIMFGLYSNLHYKALNDVKMSHIILFVIEKEDLMNLIC